MARVVVSLRGVSVVLGGNRVLEDVSLSVYEGEVYAIIGPNGSGKTTLLRVIAGLVKPTAGRVLVEGRPALVPQNDMLLPWMRLRDNILLPLRLRGLPLTGYDGRLRELARLLGLDGYLDLYPREASGGTRRKAAIARALIVDADILLLDEPFTGLDIASMKSLLDALSRLRGRKTMVLVSHEPYEIARLADRVGVLAGRPARIVGERVLRGMELSSRIEAVTGLMEEIARHSR